MKPIRTRRVNPVTGLVAASALEQRLIDTVDALRVLDNELFAMMKRREKIAKERTRLIERARLLRDKLDKKQLRKKGTK